MSDSQPEPSPALVPELIGSPLPSKHTGRKLKLTADLQQKLVDLIEQGVLIEPAAVSIGISKPTFWRWYKDGEAHPDNPNPKKKFQDFRAAILIARANAERMMTAHLVAQSHKGSTQATMFYLERACKWLPPSSKVQIDATIRPNTTPTFDPTKLSPEDLLQLESLLAKASPDGS